MNASFDIDAGDPMNLDMSQTFSLSEFAETMAGDNTSVHSDSPYTILESLPSLSESEMPAIEVAGNTNKITFNAMYYSSGSLRITFTKQDSIAYSPDYRLNVKAAIYKGTTLIAESPVTNIVQNNVIDIPLTGSNGIPQSFTVKFSGNSTGGQNGKSHQFNITGAAVNVAVKKVVNLNVVDQSYLNDAVQEINSELGFQSFAGSFSEVTFDDGHLLVSANAPSGWSGVTMSLQNLNLDGGARVSDFTYSSTVADLPAGKLIDKNYTVGAKITPDPNNADNNKADFTGKIKISVQNATIVFTDSIRVNVLFKLNKIASAKINLAARGISGFSLPTNGSEGSVELPGELLKFVDYITFPSTVHEAGGTTRTGKGFGIRCKVTNTLPAGNDIHLSLNGFKKPNASGYYYNLSDVTIPSGSESTEKEWTNTIDQLKFPAYNEGTKQYLEMNATISDATNFPVSDIELGKTYHIGISDMEVIYDWDEVSLKLGGSNLNFSDEMELPFDLASMMEGLELEDDLLSKIKIPELPLYLYAVKPSEGALASSFGSLNFEGKIYISYKQGEDTKYKKLLGTGGSETRAPSGRADISFKNSLPLPENKEALLVGNASDPNNVAHYLNADNSSICVNVADVLSLTDAEEKKVVYDIGLDGGSNLTIRHCDLTTEGNSSAELAVDLVTVISLDLQLLAPIKVNVTEFADENYNTPGEDGQYSDLLQRDDASTYEDYVKYVDSVDYVGFKYKVENQLIPSLDLCIQIKDEHGDTNLGMDPARPLEISLERSSGYKLFKLENEDLLNVMTHYPFHPDFYIQLGRNLSDGESSVYASPESLTVSRSGLSQEKPLGVGLIVAVKMNGDKPISVWQKNKGGEQ